MLPILKHSNGCFTFHLFKFSRLTKISFHSTLISDSFCFPIFTNKIIVFDSEISLSIYDQAFYEDIKEFDEEA